MATKRELPDTQPARNRPWLVYAAAGLLLAWYFFSALSAMATKSVTFDEVGHLTAGYGAWRFGDFRMLPESGILPQRLAAIPLLIGDTRFPDLNQDEWQHSHRGEFADQFFYKVGNDADSMLARGRAMIALLGVALGAVIFYWSRSLLSVGPALMSVGLFAFCPTMLANGALVTSDMAVALFFTASMLCIWRVLHDVNWRTLLIGSLVVAGLFLSKFSAFMIVPMALVLLIVRSLARQPIVIEFGGKTWIVHRRVWRGAVHLATIIAYAIAAWIVIWAAYGFRFGMFAENQPSPPADGQTAADDHPEVSWGALAENPGPVLRVIVGMRDAHFLPEAYLYGFAHTWRSTQGRRAFLNGRYTLEGWPQFFPYCLLVKTPLTLFVLMGFAAIAIVRGWTKASENWRGRLDAMVASLYRTAPLWTLFIVYWVLAITSHLNIGHRHILPTYPPMLILAGASWMWLATRPPATAAARQLTQPAIRTAWWIIPRLSALRWPIPACIVLTSLVLFAVESLWRWPNYLAYFNQVVGGPSRAYRHLVDSSLDWGQDLPALRGWLAEHKLLNSPSEKTYLSYFGAGKPSYYGITPTLLPCFWDRMPKRVPERLEAGTYCLSATMLQNLYTQFPGQWNHTYEQAYEQKAKEVQVFVASDARGRGQLIANSGEQYWWQLFRAYEHARLARLTSFLRQREPDYQVNYSILIYRLSADDVNRADD
jgi:4-amino-4-deoxy-L-arabinose transferase-like glycosyltransferase